MEPSNFIWGRSIRTMGVTVDGKGKKGGAKASKKKTEVKEEVASAPVFENPLVPHAVLREMYQKTVEMRLLSEYAAKLAHGKKSTEALVSTYGQEACRVSLTQGLGAGDLVLDAQPGGLTGYLLGSELMDVLAGFRPSRGTKAAVKEDTASRLLPFVENAETRLFAGLGVAILAKQMQRTDGVVIFVEHREVSGERWRRALTLAAKQQLPVIFMVLAKGGKGKTKAAVSGIAERCGVPGIPVDASDAVALYRVTQEAIGRIRAGGGAVLIEGVAFPSGSPGKHAATMSDPVSQLKSYLLQRQVATEAWVAEVEKTFRKQLAALRR
jgi:TPP-dependent pyruvate/acetoin dehydrogenase alpha subunit